MLPSVQKPAEEWNLLGHTMCCRQCKGLLKSETYSDTRPAEEWNLLGHKACWRVKLTRTHNMLPWIQRPAEEWNLLGHKMCCRQYKGLLKSETYSDTQCAVVSTKACWRVKLTRTQGLLKNETYSDTQCAAVNTYCWAMIVPPHRYLPLSAAVI
jgi:hypothetical protein